MGYFTAATILAAFIVPANLFLRPVTCLIGRKTSGNKMDEADGTDAQSS